MCPTWETAFADINAAKGSRSGGDTVRSSLMGFEERSETQDEFPAAVESENLAT
jgi:hypothetical protein